MVGALGESMLGGLFYINPSKVTKCDSYYEGDEAIPTPRFRTAYDKGAAGDNIIHYTAIRVRVNGEGNLNLRAYSLDDVRSEDLVALVMSKLTDIIPTRLCNFTSQRASLEGWTTEINEVFKVNHITIFVKEVAASYPG
jgi:hypothetical protein